ncbi:hypothetical protein BWQ96_08130 [Gracilariopsis chorda]|uniref:Uncharacterized protein n=1 Tax=Gracilariopsis chorda TaxID=448386 RepID=A0A2V3IJA4_9FLOR|nr:hypothetical protein BWQ96_08130 [Gracilariopsis chorda]|eukprot:PXF42152.1 hypothetical protein BWQ96_08130 [Gracilariopsis chorda]
MSIDGAPTSNWSEVDEKLGLCDQPLLQGFQRDQRRTAGGTGTLALWAVDWKEEEVDERVLERQRNNDSRRIRTGALSKPQRVVDMHCV